jgi:malate dehydrogenase (oxaloacetate-decarboxylating)(NADP+)
MSYKEEALEYHRRGRKGKIEVATTKPCVTHPRCCRTLPGNS